LCGPHGPARPLVKGLISPCKAPNNHIRFGCRRPRRVRFWCSNGFAAAVCFHDHHTQNSRATVSNSAHTHTHTHTHKLALASSSRLSAAGASSLLAAAHQVCVAADHHADHCCTHSSTGHVGWGGSMIFWLGVYFIMTHFICTLISTGHNCIPVCPAVTDVPCLPRCNPPCLRFPSKQLLLVLLVLVWRYAPAAGSTVSLRQQAVQLAWAAQQVPDESSCGSGMT
jgi:hypothetical protein